MVKIYGYYEYDDSLRPGRSDGGGLSQLLFDSEGKLSDHASFHPADSDDHDDYSYDSTLAAGDSDAQAAALLCLAVIGAAAGGYAVIRRASPHVQRMMNERALPAVRSFWKKVRGEGVEVDVSQADESSIVVAPTSLTDGDESAPRTDIAAEMPQMSPDEWYARFRAMFEARRFADEQWKLLSKVQVADDEAIPELQRVMARNCPEAVVRQVALMLEAAPEVDADADAAPVPVEVECHPGQDS